MTGAFRVTEEEYSTKEEVFRIVIQGQGLTKYKQIKRVLDLLRMRWFDTK